MEGEGKHALRVGLIGNFQEGKSTLINCLLEDRIAVTGDGSSTTKQIVQYKYDKVPHIRIKRKNVVVIIPIEEYADMTREKEVSSVSVYLPHPILRHVELWDTPGFNAVEEDNALTETCLSQLDAAIFVAGGNKELSSQQIDLIKHLYNEVHLPFIMLMNVMKRKGETLNGERKYTLEEDVHDKLRAWISALVKQGQMPQGYLERSIYPINLLLCWENVLNRLDRFTLAQSEGERMKMEQLLDFQVILERKKKNEIITKNLEYEKRLLDNLSIIREYLNDDSIAFDNFHRIVQFHGILNHLRSVFESVDCDMPKRHHYNVT